jgi:hypothetical protein
MILYMLIRTILYTDWVSWLLHVMLFYPLARWSGIKWQWAVFLVFGIEIWETADWALNDPLGWWTRLDTIMDILSGCLAVAMAEWGKHQHHVKSEV